jgi:hypothetical protein
MVFVGVSALLVLVGSAACSGGGSDGTCYVQHGTFIGPDTGYIWDVPNYYCADQGSCQTFCNSVASRDDYRGCTYQAGSACTDGSLPTPPDPSVCAITQNVTCGGQPSSSTSCYACDTVTPNKSDYDPSTDCLTQWGSKVGRGANCSDAMANLASQ